MISVSRPGALVRRGVLVGAASLLGACSCLGGGDGDIDCGISFGTVSGRVFVYNAAPVPATLTVSRVAWANCRESTELEDGFLRGIDFVPLTTLSIQPGEIRALDAPCQCPHVRVSTLGENWGVRWSKELPVVDLGSSPDADDRPKVEDQLITFDRKGAAGPSLELGSDLEGYTVSLDSSPVPEHDCVDADAAPVTYRVWRSSSLLPVELDTVHEGFAVGSTFVRNDGCFEVELIGPLVRARVGQSSDELGEGGGGGGAGAPGAAGERNLATRSENHALEVCAPVAMFPFEPGDAVDLELTHFDLDLRATASSARFRVRVGELAGAAWSEYSVRDRSPRCGPVRETGGVVWEPIELLRGDQLLVSGEIRRIVSELGMQVYAGRSLRIWNRACDTTRPLRVEIVESTVL